jgi:hypothetical protein
VLQPRSLLERELSFVDGALADAGRIADYSSFQSQQNSAVAAADASLRAAASPSGGASHQTPLHAGVAVTITALGFLLAV